MTRIVNRVSLLVLVVALLGFNAPACAMACSWHADAATRQVGAEHHAAACHESGAERPTDEGGSHDCAHDCDARALPSSTDAPCASPVSSLALPSQRSITAVSAPVAALRRVAKRARLPDRHTLLRQKTLLQV